MKNSALQDLKRRLYREITGTPRDSADVLKHGINGVLSRLAFLKEPSDKNAVTIVIEQFNREVEKLEQKGVRRDKWPKLLRDENWQEKVYQKFGVSYDQ